MGKSFSVALLAVFLFVSPAYGVDRVTLPTPPLLPGPSVVETREATPVEDEVETNTSGGVDVRTSDSEGQVDAEGIEIVPANEWFFQLDWILDVGYWKEYCRGHAHGIANAQSLFMTKFPFSLFGDALDLLEKLNGETTIQNFSGPVTIAPGVSFNFAVPGSVQTIFSMIRALNGFMIILFGTWSLAHKFISFGGS